MCLFGLADRKCCYASGTQQLSASIVCGKKRKKSMPKHTLNVFNTLSMVEVPLMYMLGHLFANGNASLKKLSFYSNLPLSLELCLWILCLHVCKIDNVNMNLK